MLGKLVIRYEQRRVTVAGRSTRLTPTEYELLRVLSLNAGRVLTYGSLFRQACSGRDQNSGVPKLVRAVVKRLRDKLGDHGTRPAYILNERGVGYRMPEPRDPPAHSDSGRSNRGRQTDSSAAGAEDQLPNVSSDEGPAATGGGRAGTAVFRDRSAPGGRGGR